MDSRNVFVAIALSLAVLLFWSAFFETPRPIETGNIVQKEKSDKKRERKCNKKCVRKCDKNNDNK